MQRASVADGADAFHRSVQQGVAAIAVLERPNRKNDEIRVPQIRVIGPDGEQVGILPRLDALRMAQDSGLDLVEIQPNADPPVCRIMDYGKFKFELQKKANLAKKKQKQIEIKEMKFRPGTDDGDFQVKMRAIRRFLEEGDKVKITVRFRGREMAHIDIGDAMLTRIAKEVGEDAVVEQRSRVEGRVMSMMISPKKKVVPA